MNTMNNYMPINKLDNRRNAEIINLGAKGTWPVKIMILNKDSNFPSNG